ncbi:restriction endonuclease subunit S [Brochothrix thermosphacta]|uniref:restriction endonuclease subunit S n=1 Tax=Brochothrix thermosphacta TaxID=2756 RepID=UPI00265CD582|nr:restriction endonuclease subunit S [Brochothrix thermosphacta]WKK69668.1 restriction endonuclease subunit S [Brochothrix thermosphacta]
MNKNDVRKLMEIAEVSAGGTPSRRKPEYWENGTIPWFKIRDMKGKYINESSEFITELGFQYSNVKMFSKGTILYSIFATIGDIAILEIDGTTNQAIAGINPDTSIVTSEYLYYYLQSLKDEVNALGRGVAQNNINLTMLKNLTVVIPKIVDQDSIVSILKISESLIKNRQSQLKALDELSQSLFLEMFGDPVKNNQSWRVANLEDITNKIGSGATPRGGKEAYKTEGISLIRSMNVHNGLFKYKDLAFIDENQAKKLENVEVFENDILLNITGASVARSCLVPKEILPARVNQHVSIIRLDSDNVNNWYVSYLFTSENFQHSLWKIATSGGATREAITKDQLKKLEIILPPITLQNEFAEKIQAIEAQKKQLTQSLAQYEELHQSLLQKAFRGELFQDVTN